MFRLNIRSLRNKLNIIDISEILIDFHILYFSEIHLDDQVYMKDIEIDQFDEPYRKDINSHLAHKRRYDLETPHTEVIWIQIKNKIETKKSLLLSGVYRPNKTYPTFWGRIR